MKATGLVATLVLFTTACGDETTGASSGDPPTPPPPAIDLVADSNRDGLVDDLDDDSVEFPWSVAGGAVFLPNVDDDNLDGIRDGETPYVDVVPGVNDADAWDLAPLDVRAWPDAPDEAVALVVMDAASMPHVRVHRLMPDGAWWPVIDAEAQCDPTFELSICDNNIFLTAADIKVGVRFGVEGKTLAGLPNSVGWSGTTQFDYAAFEFSGSQTPIADEANADGWDHVQMRVSSWQMYGNHTPNMDWVNSDDVSSLLTGPIQTAAADAGIAYLIVNDYQDRWNEDWKITGYVSMPLPDGQVHGMRLAYPRPHSQESSGKPPIEWLASPSWLGPDRGYFVTYEMLNTSTSYDSGGNHDLLPAYENPALGTSYPVGRMIHGSGVIAPTQAFYAAQLPQAPVLVVNTAWLIVGHVDEALTYLPANTPRGWKLGVASPALAISMLEQWQSQGHGAVEMFVGKSWGNGSAAISIDETLADPDLMGDSQESQGHIDAMVSILVQEIGLTPDEIVEFPVLFEFDAGYQGMVAYNPGTVNSLVFNDYIVIPDPFGPSINGVDGFKQDLIDRLGGPGLGLGLDGQGMNVYFADDWSAYHVNLGEVHCGTNIAAPPPASERWWEAAQ